MMNENVKNQIQQLKKFRGTRTQKQYAEDLYLSIRTIQNWEARGCSQTIFNILLQLHLAENKINELEKKLNDNNMTFTL